jgi:hypothetical protein
MHPSNTTIITPADYRYGRVAFAISGDDAVSSYEPAVILMITGLPDHFIIWEGKINSRFDVSYH